MHFFTTAHLNSLKKKSRPQYLVLILFIHLFLGCGERQVELTGHLGRPEISPDGKSICFIYAEDAAKDVWEIYKADISGQNAIQLTNFPEARIKKGPVWSPNGKKIAFHADIDGGAQIFLMDPDGSHLSQLTQGPGYNVEPHWSPDGKEIIFNRSIPGKNTVDMMMINADGSGLRRLPNPNGQNWYPRVTPDNGILFTTDFHHKDYWDVFIMTRDSTDVRQLTHTRSINWFPEFSPDGSKIAFTSNRDDPDISDSGNYNIYLMDKDGSNKRRLTDLPGQELHPKWHPSGTQIIFERHEDRALGLFLLDVASGDIQKIRITH
nr:hypothetical protein [Allomuricauda sp.]